ncbi:bromo adjacent y domain-containing 1 protein [Caerostris extrusa]|uniref:Bromo adjacent y domain-containing 1 protein n=1 Tax=Caerostris extrusa TaxID=172846 RepID=A0AAV4XV30_CAEEX|nr:bromo adjacent y domain-containing 1 protein [Caerostris extrusa]
MSGTKSSSRGSSVKKDGSFRYATRLLTSEKGRHNNNSSKETNSTKASELKSLLKSEGLKAAKYAPNSKVAVKKSNKKSIVTRESRRRANTDDDHETVVIVKKRSSSVSVVKQTVKTVTVSKVTRSYSTAVQLSSDEETNSDESEGEETKKKYKRKKKNVKQLTSKAKSNKKISKKAAKKAKAIKLLCDKLSAPKGKVINPVRELRPRFPYSILQELPTARAHRMASLNALAKVHVLYENEGRNVGENLNDADESSLIEFLDENSDDDDTDVPEIEKESKPPVNTNVKKNDKVKNNDKEKQKNAKKEKVPKLKAKRGKKRKLPDVEIIDTKICKRMASLNAQAILAASYLQEPKPKRVKKAPKSSPDFESKEVMACDIIIKTEIEDDVTIIETQQGMDDIEQQNESSNILPEQMNKTEFSFNKSTVIKNSTPESPKKKKPTESERVTIENNSTEKSFSSSRQCSIENSVVASSATSTKVGVTQYTEVRKVQINTHKDAEEKAGSKSERKIEQIISNDDGAITQTYHYQSKSKNESYCVQMQTTYKPASKNVPPSSQSPSDGIHPFNDSILPSNQHYYACNSMLPPQAYQLNPNLGPVSSVVAMDHRLPRQFGSSAFTVPHYRHPQPMQFPPNDYGYYQPAGPLIQPVQDNYTIHKPVPYHPQPNPHQPPQRPQQPPQHEGFQTFESLQTHPQNSSLPSVSSPILSQQKSVKHIGSSSSENISSPQSVKYQLDSKSKGLNQTNNNNSFTSQNFENYSQSKPATPPFKQFSSSVESAKSRNLSHTSNSSSFDPQISKNISQPRSSSPEFERHASVKETKARNVNRNSNNSFGPSNSDTSDSSFPQTIRHKSGDAKPSSPKFMKHQSAGDVKSRNNSSVGVQNSEIHSQHEPSSPEFMRHQSAGDTKYRNDSSYSPSNFKNPSQAKLPSPHLMSRQLADDEKSRNNNSLGPLNSESPSFIRPSSPQFMRHQSAENEKSNNNNNVYSPLNSEKQPFQQTTSSSRFMRRQHVGDVKSRNSNSFGPLNSENPLHTGPSSPQLIRQQPSEMKNVRIRDLLL